MNEVIVIAGNEYLAVSLIRSLGLANYRSRLIALTKRTYMVAGKSKYVTAKVRCRENADEVLKALDNFRLPDRKIMIMPANDRVCRMLDPRPMRKTTAMTARISTTSRMMSMRRMVLPPETRSMRWVSVL